MSERDDRETRPNLNFASATPDPCTVCRFQGARGFAVVETTSVPILDIDNDMNGPGSGARILAMMQADAAAGVMRGHLYRTAKGWRIVVTDAGGRERDRDWFTDLAHRYNVDVTYLYLVIDGGTYAARVTPKPRRVGITTYPPEPGDLGSNWWPKYHAACSGVAVCRFVGKTCTARREDLPEHVQRFLRLHDRCVAIDGEPLA